ncbi:MAG: hypothetical protein LBE04_02365, partial [Prevotellaceae bacterium]|nr:hypothetical protein [Prevotellaceae bacterium]
FRPHEKRTKSADLIGTISKCRFSIQKNGNRFEKLSKISIWKSITTLLIGVSSIRDSSCEDATV